MKPSEHLLEVSLSEITESESWTITAPSKKWHSEQKGIWAHFYCAPLPGFGWKIHVSSRLEDGPAILDIVSEIAFEFECAFKHLCGKDVTTHPSASV
jgi:hypothetical protein